jgi:Methyltransferase domain
MRASPAELVGVDLSPGMVREARARLDALGAKAHVLVMDAEQMAFRDGSFDLVTMSRAYLLPQRGAILGEIRRVLRPGGVVAIAEFGRLDSRWSWKEELYARLLPRLPGSARPGFDAATLHRELDAAGFDDVEIQSDDLDVTYANLEEWWESSMSHGERGALSSWTVTHGGPSSSRPIPAHAWSKTATCTGGRNSCSASLCGSPRQIEAHRGSGRGRDHPHGWPPRSDPSVRDYRTGLLPQVSSVESLLRVGVQHAGLRQPPIEEASHSLPGRACSTRGSLALATGPVAAAPSHGFSPASLCCSRPASASASSGRMFARRTPCAPPRRLLVMGGASARAASTSGCAWRLTNQPGARRSRPVVLTLSVPAVEPSSRAY